MPRFPILRRELTRSTRRGEVFHGRTGVLGLVVVSCAACLAIREWEGRNWRSFAGSAGFARVLFELILGLECLLLIGVVPSVVSSILATERDRKTLDSLLATRLTSAEIVLGAMAAGLARCAIALAPPLPLLVLLMPLGHIDPGLLWLALAALLSTAFALAALAVAVSVATRSAAHAASFSVGLMLAWFLLPGLLVMLLPRLWPSAAPWVAPLAVAVLQSSPVGLLLHVGGIVARGSLVVAVIRMVALQIVVAAVLLAWAIARLRPASRAVVDAEGRASNLRSLRARWRPRPACGRDPVLWHELHSTQGLNKADMFISWLINAVLLAALATLTAWFAWPAFVELYQGGYGPGPESLSYPEPTPLARMLVASLSRLPAAGSAVPGQARLEFNIVSRQITAVLDLMFVLVVAGSAAESVAVERQRDTWLGLIATPLTGREILRAKLIGAIWRARGLGFVLLTLWTLGLLAGAVHPLGFLAAVLGLGSSSLLLAAFGVVASLKSRDRSQAANWVLAPLMLGSSLGAVAFIVPGSVTAVLATASSPFLAWAMLLSHDDVRAMLAQGTFPPFVVEGLTTRLGAGTVLALWLVSTIGQTVAAIVVLRRAEARFDAIVGRPVLPRR